jgi:uncharacterized protein DUF6526
MAERVQTYKNHVRWFPPFHFFVTPILLLYFLNQVRHLYLAPSRSTAFAVLVAAALFMLALVSRLQANTVQDRVIRLEMRLKLHEVLPPDLHARIKDLTPRQLVALRFAGDAELPGLVRDVLDGRLSNPKDIKLKIRDWQADWLRA